jgi:hypothetical protein
MLAKDTYWLFYGDFPKL